MHLVIRADGGPKIGYGHLVRSGAVAAEFLRNGHSVTYATCTPEHVREVCPDSVSIFILSKDDDRSEFIDWIDDDIDIVLTDSYDVDTEYQTQIAAHDALLAVVLDDTRYEVCADILINGNIYAPSLNYDWVGSEPEWLLGTDYLLLREEIRSLARCSPPWRDSPERAIVTMGGSDVRNLTPVAVRALPETDISVDVIIGPGFQNEPEIHEAVGTTDVEATIHRNPDNLAKYMFEADFAISALGSTTYELMALQTPIVGVVQADNQMPIAKALSDRNSGLILDQSSESEIRNAVETYLVDSDQRRMHRRNGASLVDGEGTKRVYQKLIDMATKT